MPRESPSRATIYAAWIVMLAEAAEQGLSFRVAYDADSREEMAMRWIEHYARQGEHPDITEVDDVAEQLKAKYLE